MPNHKPKVSDKLSDQVIEAIRQMRLQIRWKPGKDTEHLITRIKHGHLSDTATLTDYHAIIATILKSDTAEVYIYVQKDNAYPTIVDYFGDRRWVVIFSLAAIMETAFPPDEPDDYLTDSRFRRVGKMKELFS